jgi:hypothetical protein
MKNMRVASLVVLSLLVVSSAAAQFLLRGTIDGLVTDETGAVIVGATVTLTDLDRNQASEATTNQSGLYSFPNLVSGNYQVSVEQAGFKTGISDLVVITTNDNIRVDIAMQIGDVTETVEVTTAAPLLQTEQTVVGQVVDQTLVEALPALGRNFLAFSTLAPNVSSFPRSGTANATWSVGSHHTVGGVATQVGGGGDNGLYLNGVNINDSWLGGTQYSPGMENVQEVKVDTANFTAASGRDLSTNSVIIKAGTNEFHGGVFEYLENEALNAWHPFVKAESEPGQRKDKLQRNQFGGNLGGPVRLPGVFDGRNRAFFFAGYEGFDNNSGNVGTGSFGGSNLFRVPTSAERQGDFSGLLSRFPNDPNVILYNPFTTRFDAAGNSIRDPIINNDLRTTGMLNQTALQQINDIYPVSNGFVNPNNPDDLRNHRVISKRTNYNWRIDTRFDYRITDNDNIYVAYSESRGIDDNRGGLFPDLDRNVEDKSYVLAVSYARVFTPTLTSDFTFGYVRPNLYSVDDGTLAKLAKTDTPRNRHFQNLGDPNQIGFGMHSIGVEGYSGHGISGSTVFDNPGLQYGNNTSWVKGDHSFKFGFNYVNKGERVLSAGGRNVFFGRQSTRSGSIDDSLGGDGMASWMLGLPNSMRNTNNFGGELPWRVAWNDVWGFYFSDKWQVTPKLTLNLGMRFDVIVPTYSPGDYCCALLDRDFPGWQLVVPGRADGVPRKALSADKNNFGPRLGISYRLKPDLVVRANYGIFYQGGISEIRARTSSNLPASSGETISNAALGVHDDQPLLRFDEIFRPGRSLVLGNYPVSTGTGTGYFEFPYNCTGECHLIDQESQRDPYYQRWMVDIQQSLGQDMVLSLSYQGARGTKLPYREAVNAPAYQTGWPDDANFVDQRRPNPNGRFRDVRVVRHGNNSFYNAATVKLERRFSKGLQFTSHYTWSKTVTDPFLFLSEYLELYRTAASQLQWDTNRHLGRGEAEYSHPHRWVSAVVWQPEFGRNLPPAARFLVHGWRTSVITTFESGNAWTVFNGQTSARDFEPEMPNRIGDPNLARGSRTSNRYFDQSAFSDPGFDVKGNSGPGTVRGPGQNNFNFNLAKTFSVTEKWNVEFRAEMYNLFNHTQFKEIDTTFSTFTGSTFGWVTGAHDGRFLQFGLRVTF